MTEWVVVRCDNCEDAEQREPKRAAPEGMSPSARDWYIPPNWSRGVYPGVGGEPLVGDLCPACSDSALAGRMRALEARQKPLVVMDGGPA